MATSRVATKSEREETLSLLVSSTVRNEQVGNVENPRKHFCFLWIETLIDPENGVRDLFPIVFFVFSNLLIPICDSCCFFRTGKFFGSKM